MMTQTYWLLGLIPLLIAASMGALWLRRHKSAAMTEGMTTHSLEALYLSDAEQQAIRSSQVTVLSETLSTAEENSFYVMIESISRLPSPERDHLIHALDVLDERNTMQQLLFGFLLVEKAKEVRHFKDPNETQAEQTARSQELARLAVDALQGLSQSLERLWEKDLYFHSLIAAGIYSGDVAGRQELWLTRLGERLGHLPWTARTLCLAYSSQWHGSSELCLEIARKIFEMAEPGSPASGIIVYAHDLIFYHKRFVQDQPIDPPSYYSQPQIRDEILKSLKKWYAVKEKTYGFQRSTLNDRITNVLLFLGYPQDALKALLRSHPADAVWCIKKMIKRTGLYNHIVKTISDNTEAPKLNYLR